ncbi:MAG: serine/threonine-protein phosphatase [Candidatus Krumholzibacteriota bacterium]|nr:serine/threonine-protein phosphatase [Candidatus Krumholzibacteriota bacterium]
MEIVGKSIDGRMDYNQDRIFQSRKGDAFILAVADGMGGSGGGEIASQIVINICRERFEMFASSPDPGSLEKEINELVSLSQKKIREKFTEEADLKGMGTTLTIVLGTAEEYVVGNIGDSRTYLLSGGSLRQITKDNSFIQEYRDNHLQGDADAPMLDKMSHVLTHSLSGGDDTADLYPGDGSRFSIREGDMLLLCSDGLIIDKIGNINDKLLEMITGAASPAEAANRLIDWAYTNGSIDNISILLCAFSAWPEAPAPQVKSGVPGSHQKRKRLPVYLSIIIVFAIILTFLFTKLGKESGISLFDNLKKIPEAKPAVECVGWSIERYDPAGDRIRWKFVTRADSIRIREYLISYHDIVLDETYHDRFRNSADEDSIWAGDLTEFEDGRSYMVWIAAITESDDTLSTKKLLIKGKD